MKSFISFFCLTVFLVILMLVSLSLGRYPLGMSDFYRLLLGQGKLSETSWAVLLYLRLPRILAAVLVGASLSASGAVFQAMFVNPIVSPGILGALSGASFGALLGMLLGKSWHLIQCYAFLGGIMAVFLALGVALIFREEPILMLILGGIISSSLFASLTSVIKMVADPYDKLPAMVYWLMGGLSNVEPRTVALTAPVILVCIVMLSLLSPYLNLLSQGEEEAKSLGVNTALVRLIFIVLSTLISSLTVILAGVIQGVGLVVPHIARMLFGVNNRTLIPSASILGAVFLLIVDDISRTLLWVEIPLGITSSFIGIAFFVAILKNARRGWG